MCRQFCKDWGAGKILQQFSMVWLLHLREERIAKAKKINDLFQHYNKKLQRELVEQIEETGGEGNALDCNGFDELSKQERTQKSLFLDIIKDNVLPNCPVIVTSRPYASLVLQKLDKITHHMEIVEFTEEQIKIMLLFLSGITGLHDTRVYKRIVNKLIPQHPKDTLKHLAHTIFLAHLMYKSRNASLSHILASSVQQDGKLILDFTYLDLF